MASSDRRARRAAVWLLAIVASVPVRTSSAQSASFPSDSALRVLVQRFVTEGRSAGVVVGLLDSNGEQRVAAYGTPGPGKLSLDGNSVFRIASMTKSFTAALLALMVVDGTVGLDDPVQRWVPAGVKIPEHNGHAITLRHLATHTSGLPKLPPGLPTDGSFPPGYSVDQLYAYVSAYMLPRDPGERWEYSSMGVSLLAHALAHVAGKPYEQLIAERILAPLGMTHTAFTPTSDMEAHLAIGHSAPRDCRSGGGCRADVVPRTVDAPAILPAGGLFSTTNDLLRYLAASVTAEKGSKDTLSRALAITHRRHFIGDVFGRPGEMGLVWYMGSATTDPIIWTGGGTLGYGTFMAFTRSGRAVVVLTNGSPEAFDLGLYLVDPSTPLRPAPSPAPQGKPWFVVAISGAVAVVAAGVWSFRRRATH